MVESFILILMILFSGTIPYTVNYIVLDNLVIFFDEETIIDSEKLLTIFSRYGYGINEYCINISSSKYIVYKPWYDKYYVIVIGEEKYSEKSRWFIEIIKLGIKKNNDIISSNRSIYEVLYREISFLLNSSILINFTGNIYNGETRVAVASDVIENTILETNINPRPPIEWGEAMNQYIAPAGYIDLTKPYEAENRGETTSKYLEETTTSRNPVLETSNNHLLDTNASTQKILTGDNTYSMKILDILISFIVAVILSVSTYIILKKT